MSLASGRWRFDEMLLTACSPRERQVIEAEVEMLIAGHSVAEDATALAEAAVALEEASDQFEHGRARLKLWAAALRRRAADIR
jgi:hypothetical protein